MSDPAARFSGGPGFRRSVFASIFVLWAVTAYSQSPTPVPVDDGPTLARAAAELRSLPALGVPGTTDRPGALTLDTPAFRGNDPAPVVPGRPGTRATTPAKGPVWVEAPEPTPRAGRSERSGRSWDQGNAALKRADGLPAGGRGATGPGLDATAPGAALPSGAPNPLAPFMQQWVGAHDLRVLEQAGVLAASKTGVGGGAPGGREPGRGALAPRWTPDRAERASLRTDGQLEGLGGFEANPRPANPYLTAVQPGLETVARLPGTGSNTGSPAFPGPRFPTENPGSLVAPTPTPTPPAVIYVPPATDDAKYFKQLKKF